jgi:GH24 family phage-related lysozyme (muramidase)
MLEESEGFKDELYYDHNNNPTVGYGINLNDDANKALMGLHGVDVDSLYVGGKLDKDQAATLKEKVLDRKESELRSHISDDMFDRLQPNKQAALMSLMYNSRNLIGPQLRQQLASDDDLAVGREMLLNSNPKNELGTLVRRTGEAETYVSPEKMNDLFRSLNMEEQAKLKDILEKTQNENVKRDYLEKYGQYLNPGYNKPLNFNKLLK